MTGRLCFAVLATRHLVAVFPLIRVTVLALTCGLFWACGACCKLSGSVDALCCSE